MAFSKEKLHYTILGLSLAKGFRSKALYLFCRYGMKSLKPIRLWIKKIPIPLYCRPGTTDAAVLWDTFGEGFHLPLSDLPRDPIIVDLGANVGYTGVDYVSHYPNARVIVVEMDKDNFAVAKLNLMPYSNQCTIIHGAAWIEDGQITYKGTQEWAYRVTQSNINHNASSNTSPSFTIPSIMNICNIQHIDFLKIDIEGAEQVLFQHDLKWLQSVNNIVIEIHDSGTNILYREKLSEKGFLVMIHPKHNNAIYARRIVNI